jgi:hypothetical protein
MYGCSKVAVGATHSKRRFGHPMGSRPAQESAYGNRLPGMRRPYHVNRQCNNPEP